MSFLPPLQAVLSILCKQVRSFLLFAQNYQIVPQSSQSDIPSVFHGLQSSPWSCLWYLCNFTSNPDHSAHFLLLYQTARHPSKSMRLPQGLSTHCFLCLEHLSSDICMASFFIPIQVPSYRGFPGPLCVKIVALPPSGFLGFFGQTACGI